MTDAATREGLGKAVVECGGARVETAATGAFVLKVEAACQLRVAAVGYRPLSVPVNDGAEIEVALQPDTLKVTQSLTVQGGPFAAEEANAVGLAGNELRNLASVLADDPLRAMQSLPGVTSQDDFQSQFSVRAAAFQRLGLYVDGILLHAPFHTVQGDPTGASLTSLEGELLETANLHPGPPPVRFSDRTAGALEFRTRDGSRARTSARATASASNAGISGEGPLGKHGSWLAAARKSYLQYIIERTANDPTIAFGFWDAQAKLQWTAGANTFGAMLLDGHSGLDRTAPQAGLNSVVDSGYHFTLATAFWRFARGPWLASQRGGWLRERFENRNRQLAPLQGGHYGEWLWNGDFQWSWARQSVLDFGGVFRRLRDHGYWNRVQTTLRRIDDYDGTARRAGGYIQQMWGAPRGWRFTVGGRWDYQDRNQRQAFSPYASLAWTNRVTMTWSQAVQYPELGQLLSRGGNPALLEERASQFQLTLQQPLGEQTRFRVELYSRHDRDLLFRPSLEPRLLNGAVITPPLVPAWENSQRAYARGIQVILQRRAANGLNGWLAYGYGRSRVRDGVLGMVFPADFDLRHSLRAYGSWRVRPTVNLSVKFTAGTGLPVWGFFERRGQEFFLAAERNQLRLPAYQRTDLRLNKAFVRKQYQLTLFAEVVNLTNRDNLRFDQLTSFDARTGRARPAFDTMLPVLPSAGMVIDF